MSEVRRLNTQLQMRPLVGYYTSADQENPDYDPSLQGPCPVCGELIAGAEDCRTVSIMWAPGEGRACCPIALFYRLHRACHDAMGEEAQRALDYTVLRIGDEIARGLLS
jgi:predicted RNA-binding Zn-ribbon protein involved in translation (DUF1610 family)